MYPNIYSSNEHRRGEAFNFFLVTHILRKDL